MPDKFPTIELGILFVGIHRRESFPVKRPHTDIGLSGAGSYQLAIVGEVHARNASLGLVFGVAIDSARQDLPSEAIVKREHASTDGNTHTSSLALDPESVTILPYFLNL